MTTKKTAFAKKPAVDSKDKAAAAEAFVKGVQEKEELRPLNFKMPASFDKTFRLYAVQTDRKLSEMLTDAFEALLRAETGTEPETPWRKK